MYFFDNKKGYTPGNCKLEKQIGTSCKYHTQNQLKIMLWTQSLDEWLKKEFIHEKIENKIQLISKINTPKLFFNDNMLSLFRICLPNHVN